MKHSFHVILTALLLTPLAALHVADAKSSDPSRDDADWLREKGKLIFHDAFDREETGNGLKAIGNGWENATADRVPHIKQADLDGGILKIASATKEAGHAAHIYHRGEFCRRRGDDPLPLSGPEPERIPQTRLCRSRDEGHPRRPPLLRPSSRASITLMDWKTGVMNLEIRQAPATLPRPQGETARRSRGTAEDETDHRALESRQRLARTRPRDRGRRDAPQPRRQTRGGTSLRGFRASDEALVQPSTSEHGVDR